MVSSSKNTASLVSGSGYRSPQADRQFKNRWLVLAIVGLAQLMVVLDATVVNIALPEAQQALGFSDGSRQWVITAYALAFGSLLLVGGRLGDHFGRKTTFTIGAIGFAIASALGGMAGSFELLVIARAAQGIFGALLAPAGLALLSTTFTDPSERAKAFGVYGAIAGSGSAIGLILGGFLTEYLSWRWCMYVNLVMALPVAIGGITLLTRDLQTTKRKPDLLGVFTSTSGLFLLVWGLSKAESHGWEAFASLGPIAAGIALLTAFVVIEKRVAGPLLPIHIVANRVRGGAYLAMLIAGTGIFAVFLFLTYFLQTTLGYSPVRTGFAFLPMVAGLMIFAAWSNLKLMAVLGRRTLATIAMLLAALGMVALTRLEINSTYVADVMPALLVTGAGMGMIFAICMSSATIGVAAEESGVASATLNTAQQIGGSLGTALLTTFFTTATQNYAAEHQSMAATSAALLQAQSAVHGYTVAFGWAAAIFALGAIGALLLFPSRANEPEADGNEFVAVH